jgi:predicted RND superfamily exporter protein
MMHSFRLMSLLALGVIVVIVTVDFGHWREILLALLPLALGTIWTSEFMGLLDIPFNLANFFSVPILIGLSVNGSVYVLHRHREGGATRFTLGATRRAVIVTTLNTMIGFGCLMLAHHRGLRSLGQVMVIGTASYLFATLIVLPAVLSWLEIAREKRANA